ncbi:MAG: flagellar motor protein MotB [Syntrophomonadaceae bacterium]|jgi:chemotaxis protein MotB
MRKRKKAKHEEKMDESWLVPYSDILTLLLALFIVMYAMSSVDQGKFEELRETLNALFSGGPGVLVSDQGLSEIDDNPYTDNPPPNYLTEDRTLREYKAKMEAFLEQEGLSHLVSTRITEAGLLITVEDLAFFDSGKADLRPESLKLINFLGVLLEDIDNDVQIGGHTDSLPIHTAQYPSNWYLSTDRALSVLEIFNQNPHLAPQRFSVVGYGEYRSVASNDSSEGRQKNRRVEILVFRQYTLPPVTADGIVQFSTD